MRRAAVFAAVALGAAAGASAGPAGNARVDFHAGTLEAAGAGAPDPRAPSPALGRLAAERTARKNARAHLVELAGSLPADGHHSVADRCTGPCAARLAQLVSDEAEDIDVRYFSDGAVKLRARVPLEVVRGVLDPRAPTDAPAWSDDAPSALVVDASKLAVTPAVAARLRAGNAELRGPVLYHWQLAAALADPRLGPRPVQLVATAADGSDLTLAPAAAPQLVTARRTGALVVIVAPETVR